MSKYNIPTPAEVDFYNTKEIDATMELIVGAINERRFEFSPREQWISHFERIKQELSEYWKLEQLYHGSREDSTMYWKLTPKV